MLTATAVEIARSGKLSNYRIDVVRGDGKLVAAMTGTTYITGKPVEAWTWRSVSRYGHRRMGRLRSGRHRLLPGLFPLVRPGDLPAVPGGRPHARRHRGGQWKEGTPLVAAECSFKRASQTGEKLVIESQVSRFGRSSFTISHVFRDASGEIAAEGSETRIWARKEGDARTLKAIAIPEDVRRRLGG